MPQNQQQYVVITSVNSPTEAIRAFADQKSWQLIVVGDKKTPSPWAIDGVIYIAPEQQNEYPLNIPWNHYSRKMIGYLYAMNHGASVIADSDDDNIPLGRWGFPPFDGVYETIENFGFVNMYRAFTSSLIWPRGLPLSEIHAFPVIGSRKYKRIGIWQGLVDDDPDVDAIYRLMFSSIGSRIRFNKSSPKALSFSCVCPFNSQNTLFRKELFLLMYLPHTVNQRFSDILRGIVAQAIMWSEGFCLGFTAPNAIQIRNKHDLKKDFLDEVPCYMQTEEAFLIASRYACHDNMADNLYSVYEHLIKSKIVKPEEMETLHNWIMEVNA